MTTRLYYTEPYRVHFTAQVRERLSWEGHPAVILDQTLFYPTSGGQPADRGALNGIPVLDVTVRESDGAVVHILADELREERLEGAIDWPRRFDHMQQHTGQHLLSAAFERVLGADTVGFHLGTQVSTIDIACARLGQEAVTAVEELTNQIVWEDRPVVTRFVTSAELAALPLRRPPAVAGPIRIVEILGPAAHPEERFDISPCGGTHVARTGEVGLVKITGLEYRGELTRIAFLCGRRALSDYQARFEVTARLANKLTVGYWELEQTIERLQAEEKRLLHELRQARERLLLAEATELAGSAVAVGPYQVICHLWEQPGRPPEELRALALALTRRPGTIALLMAISERTHLCFARGEDVDIDVVPLLRDCCARLEGKGGGRPHLAQGSTPMTDPRRVGAALDTALHSLYNIVAR
ncbi:MAG: DHHA1 domain-containing protein [Anaerolineae bacterium]|nr:DHHA1 domain-containing protein [Anaerolineae bacterium]